MLDLTAPAGKTTTKRKGFCLRETPVRRLRRQIRETWASFLDLLYAPVISRLTDEQYFSCRTRNDCVRAMLARKTAA